jgi:hypothetical protein
MPNAAGFLIGHLAIGAVDIAMVAWAWSRPPAARRIALVPILVEDPAIDTPVLEL